MIELASVEHNEEALCLNLYLLDEKRDQVQKRTEDYQRKTTRYYNQKVKPRSYKPGDLVLKKLMPVRKNPTHGKLGPNWEGLYIVSRVVKPGNYELQTEEGKVSRVGLKSPKIELESVEHNEEALRLNLDLLDEKRDQVQKRTEDYQRKMARYYNQKVKPKSYKLGDLVLKKLLPVRKNPTHGKLGPYIVSRVVKPVITSSRRKKEKFYLTLGTLSTLSVFISRPHIVIFNKVSSAFR